MLHRAAAMWARAEGQLVATATRPADPRLENGGTHSSSPHSLSNPGPHPRKCGELVALQFKDLQSIQVGSIWQGGELIFGDVERLQGGEPCV